MANTGSSHPLRDLTPYLIYLLTTSTLGPLLFGYHLAELNAPQDVITCVRKSVEPSTFARIKDYALGTKSTIQAESLATKLPQCIPMSPSEFGAVSSLFTLGGLVGALAAGPLSSKYGRLKTMLFTTIFFTAGPVLEALAPSIAVITIGRFVSGLGAGAAMVAVPIYISEIAPPGKKGFFGSFTQVMVNMGIFITQLLGMFLSRGQLWRIILAVAGVIGLIMGIGLLIAGQESPRWLVDNGKPSRARRALRRIRGHEADLQEEVEGWGTNEDSRDLADEEETLLANEDRMQTHHPSIDVGDEDNNDSSAKTAVQAIKHETIGAFEVLRDPDLRQAVIAVSMVMLAQQLCGINSIVMYGVSLLADLLAANSALLNVLVALFNVIVTAGCAPLVDTLGRKFCLLLSIGGMGSMSVLLAIGIMKHIPILSGVAVLLFVGSFGVGLGPVPFILASELVSSEAVGATQSWALAANWAATFVVAQFFPIVNQLMPKGTVYFIFAAFAVLFGTFVALKVPETKGKRDANEAWGRGKVVERED